MRGSTNLFDLQDVTGHDLRGFDFPKRAIAKYDGFKCESLFQFVHVGAGLEFLDETDTCVEQQQTANDTEIDPVGETSCKHSGSLQLNLSASHCVVIAHLGARLGHPSAGPMELRLSF